jgi:hypothetical protein
VAPRIHLLLTAVQVATQGVTVLLLLLVVVVLVIVAAIDTTLCHRLPLATEVAAAAWCYRCPSTSLR